MSRLEEIKQQYAKPYGYNDWIEFINDEPNYKVEHHMDNICKIYAKECSQASLGKASKVAKTFKNSNSGSYLDAKIDKQSIIQELNIVLL